MTPAEADAAQDWAGMDGVTAWHLIDRHADNWGEIGAMMDAWLRANVQAATAAERERAAKVCDAETSDDQSPYQEQWDAGWSAGAEACAAAIRKGL